MSKQRRVVVTRDRIGKATEECLPQTHSPPLDRVTSDDLTAVWALLQPGLQDDFRGSRQGSAARRIRRRVWLNRLDSMAAYLDLLRNNPEEVQALGKDLQLDTGRFFPDPEAWEAVDQLVLGPLVERAGEPHMMARGVPRAAIRGWVPGCGTGAEAYSLAILLDDRRRAAERACDLQIFATDIDHDALTLARAGVYAASVAAAVSPQRLRRYFVQGEHTSRVVRAIRDAVVFSAQDLLRDPPFAHLDLICCPNLLTELGPEAQQRLLALFHFALREGGHLFLGRDEILDAAPAQFELVSHPWPIYRRLRPERRSPTVRPARFPRRSALPWDARAVERLAERGSHDLASLAQQLIFQRYAPACALVNRRAEILYLSAAADRYLELSGGEGANLMACARAGLRVRLQTALEQAIREDRRIECRGARPPSGEQDYDLHLAVEPVRPSPDAEPLWLVSLAESDSPQVPASGLAPAEPVILPAPPDSPPPAGAKHTRAARLRHRNDGLHDTREELRSKIAELEAANEKAQAATAEWLSMNEELQAANEDLEASREELQSVNEELRTLNDQLEQKLAELEATNDDLANLLNSTQCPAFFLDRQFRLRRFTPTATRLFSVRETDIGRPLSDLAPRFMDEDLMRDAEQVLQQLAVTEKEVPTPDGTWYVRRIHPFVTEGNRVEGVVLIFSDITRQKQQEALLRRSREQLELAQLAAGQGVWDWQIPTGRIEWSPQMFALLGLDRDRDTPTCASWEAVFHPDDRPLIRQRIDRAIRDRSILEYEARVVHPDGQVRWLAALGRAAYDGSGNALRMLGVCMDITERKYAEQALRASEERLHALVTAGSYVVYRLSPDGSEMRQLHGGTRFADIESPSRTWLDRYIPPDDQPQVLAAIQDAIRRKGVLELEHRAIRADGSVGWVFSRAVPVLDDRGDITEWFGAASDITDRKDIEDATLRAIPDLVFETDREGRIFNYHAPDHEQLYLPHVRFLGRRVGEVLPPDAAVVCLRALAEADEKGYHRGAVYCLDISGGRRWFELSIAANRRRRGAERRFTVLARDITERKRSAELLELSEAAYRTIFDSVDAMLVVHDPDTGAILDVNRKFLEMMGVDREQARRQGIRDLLSPHTMPEEFQQICQAARDGQPQVVEFSGRYKDGREYWALGHLQYVSLGGQLRLLANVHDVTELKHATQALAEARDAAEAANRAKGQFLANISHELRTPMTAVLGMLELSLRDRLRPELREHLQLAKNAADVQLELLNEILDFSRVEAGKIALAAVEFNLRTTLEETLKVLAVKAHEKGLEFQFHLPRLAPVHLVGDPFRLREILFNLVGNAIKFTETGEVVVRVAVESQTAQDVLLRFAVTDTGIGISRADQAKIFRPFNQADASLARRYGGTGLGLTIASSLAALMDGQLSVDSVPGRGSTFTLMARFPRLDEETPPLEQAFLPQLRDLRVLVVDHHATGRQIVCEILGDWSLQPTPAASLSEAVAAAEQRAAAEPLFRLMIVDAGLLTGEESAWQDFLRRQGRQPPAIVALTPCGSLDAARSLQKLRQRAILVEKPVSQHGLLLALVRGLGIEAVANQRQAGGERLAPAPHRLRILVADDAPVGRLFVSETLQERGHAVWVATNGREALTLVQDQPFDVVLMDVQMPEMDGFQATAAIRALPDPAKSQMPIVALTAHARLDDEQECLAAGMNAYLSKPFTTEALIELVDRLSEGG